MATEAFSVKLQLQDVKLVGQWEQGYGLTQCEASLRIAVYPLQQQLHDICRDVSKWELSDATCMPTTPQRQE